MAAFFSRKAIILNIKANNATFRSGQLWFRCGICRSIPRICTKRRWIIHWQIRRRLPDGRSEHRCGRRRLLHPRIQRHQSWLCNISHAWNKFNTCSIIYIYPAFQVPEKHSGLFLKSCSVDFSDKWQLPQISELAANYISVFSGWCSW